MTFHDVYKSVFDHISSKDQDRIRDVVDDKDADIVYYGTEKPENIDKDEILERMIVNGLFAPALEIGDIDCVDIRYEQVPEEIIVSVEAVIEHSFASICNMIDIRDWLHRNDDLA